MGVTWFHFHIDVICGHDGSRAGLTRHSILPSDVTCPAYTGDDPGGCRTSGGANALAQPVEALA
jgi:hypothetical protein